MAGPKVNALVLKQKNHLLYLFRMSSDLLNRLTYVTPRTHDDPTEIQRILRKRHTREIAAYIKEPNTLLPTAVVVSLEESVKLTPTADDKEVVIEFPDEAGKFAYVLDGQHRLRAFEEVGVPQVDLPVVALVEADEATRAKVFADINSKQEPITDNHILELYYQIKDLPADEIGLVDIVHTLNAADDSPLKGKVKLLDVDRGTWVKNTILKRFLRRALTATDIEFIPAGQQATILKEYLKAVAALWPEAWGDNKGYSLSGSAGLEVMLGAFPAVKDRVDLNKGKQYTRENFLDQMEPLRDASISIELTGEQNLTLLLDWSKTELNVLSRSQKGRETLITKVRHLLFLADRDPDAMGDDGVGQESLLPS